MLSKKRRGYFKRKYTKHYERLRPWHEDLLIRRAKEEWQQAEQALKKHERIQRAKRMGLEVGKWILGLGLVAGTVMLAAAAPNAVAAVVKASTGSTRREYASLPRSVFERRIKQGSTKKYWRYSKSKSGTYTITLTRLGRQIALRAELRNFKLHPQPTWDGKWRLVMFDIPKKYSGARDALRRKLYEIGMHRVQDSVFIYPHQCTDEAMMWVELFGMGAYVEMAEAEFSPDSTHEFKQIFKMKS